MGQSVTAGVSVTLDLRTRSRCIADTIPHWQYAIPASPDMTLSMFTHTAYTRVVAVDKVLDESRRYVLEYSLRKIAESIRLKLLDPLG